MTSYFSQWVSKRVDTDPFEPGIYHYLAPEDDLGGALGELRALPPDGAHPDPDALLVHVAKF